MRYFFRMPYTKLLTVIDDRLEALGLSERKACLMAGLKVDAIRTIRRGNAPKVETLSALAPILKLPRQYLFEMVLPADNAGPPAMPISLATVFVRGSVEAGVWREAIEWHEDDWYSVTAPSDDRYPGIERFGLLVRGNSMDRIYPEGTILVCVRFADIARSPEPGDRVICLRRSRTGEYEATVKEYDLDAQGRHVLWPRSTQPEYQTPIILTGKHVPIGGYEKLPDTVHAGEFADDGMPDDLWISALVTASVRLETGPRRQ